MVYMVEVLEMLKYHVTVAMGLALQDLQWIL